MQQVSSKSTRNLLNHLLFFAAYCLIVWFVHMFVVSIASFIHFLLEHDLRIIEDWITDQGWQIIIISKVLALIPIYIWFEFKNDSKNFLISKMSSGINTPDIEAVVLIIAAFTLTLLFNVISSNNTFTDINFFRFSISYLGTVVFILTDFIIIHAFNFVMPISQRHYIVGCLLLPAITQIATIIIFPYCTNFNASIYLNLSMVLLLTKTATASWGNSLLFVLACIGPFASFLGTDILWGNHYSLYKISHENFTLAMAAFYIIAICYSHLKTTIYNNQTT